jgi:hypothetical protein
MNSTDHRALLLRYFKTCGNRLFAALFYKHDNPNDVLENCATFLNRNFSESALISQGSSNLCDSSSADRIHAYLAPFESILRGIISRYGEEGKYQYQQRLSWETMVAAIYSALSLLAEAKTYAMASDREDFWYIVTDVFRNRVMISTGLSPLIGKNFLNQLESTKAVELFEEGLCREDNANGQSIKLYLSVMAALGESIHINTITELLKRHSDECGAISESLQICIDVLTAGHRRIFFTKHITAYVKATLENVTGFLNRNQFLLPRSLANLPNALKVSGAEGEIMNYKRRIEDRIINVLTTFHFKNITRVELDLLYRSPSIIDSFNQVARNWDVDSSELKVF